MLSFKEVYCKTLVSNLAQILANSRCSPQVVKPDQSRGPKWLVAQHAPMASVVVIWDVYLGAVGSGPYVGSVRLEFGHHCDVQSTLNALLGIEGVLHGLWCDSPMGTREGTADPLPAWCMAPPDPADSLLRFGGR